MTGPERTQDVARLAAEREEYHERTGYWPKRIPLPPPWGEVKDFRRRVLSQLFGTFDKANEDGTRAQGAETGTPLIVSHRPVKRKAKGYLHKEDLWGAVDEKKGIFRKRCPVSDLKPKMLRMPVPETDSQARKRLTGVFQKQGKALPEARKAAKNCVRRRDFERQLVDPALWKGGLVRDWELRRIIRECLTANGIDPDGFTEKQMKEFAKTGKLRMPHSGVPIRTVIIKGPISDPVKIAVTDPNTRMQASNPRTGKPLFRYHISRNNHHVEIMRDASTGNWCARNGKCVTMYEAAQRVRPPKHRRGKGPKQPSAVNREDADGQTFVISLSEGEMIHAKRPDRPQRADYFVVVKLDNKRIYFASHWDARSEKEQDRWSVTYSNLEDCGLAKDTPPIKVRVDPLGQLVQVHHD